MNSRTHLIVPMAGYGSRFKKSGYETYKPFIKINGKTMIDYVLDAFPRNMNKYIIINPELLTQEQIRSLEQKSNVKLINIAPHKNGPGYSIVEAKESLPLEDSFFYTYCDIAWTWDFEEVFKHAKKYEGVIYTRQKFHPHLVGNSFSAFCKLNESNEVIEIKEKGPFTDDWMEEPLSIGAFYVRSGKDLIWGLERRISNDERVADEFFPSVIFNDLIKINKKVGSFDVDFFIHWGVPAQLEDFAYWAKVVKKDLSELKNNIKFKNLCCMGGLGNRMKNVSSEPKALISIQNAPMFQYVSSRFPIDSSIFLTVDSIFDQVNRYVNDPDIAVNLGAQTKTQIDTLKLANKVLKESKNFLLTSCDAYGYFDEQIFEGLRTNNPTAIIFTFSPTLFHSNLKATHSHVSVEKNKVTGVHIKSKKHNSDMGLAGFFWFRDGVCFKNLDQVRDEGDELIIDHFLKHLVEVKKEEVLYCCLDEYLHLGTPEELREYFFWHFYKDILLANY